MRDREWKGRKGKWISQEWTQSHSHSPKTGDILLPESPIIDWELNWTFGFTPLMCGNMWKAGSCNEADDAHECCVSVHKPEKGSCARLEFVPGHGLAGHLGTSTSWHRGTQNLSPPQFKRITAHHVKIPELATKEVAGAAATISSQEKRFHKAAKPPGKAQGACGAAGAATSPELSTRVLHQVS